jgi:hypothetical protein
MADNKTKTIWVESGLGNNRVALWERDDAHPGGEAWVAGKGKAPVQVGETALVRRLIGDRQLVEVSAPSKHERAAAPQLEANRQGDNPPPDNPEPKKGK